MERIFISSYDLAKLKPISGMHTRVCKYSVMGTPHILKFIDGSQSYTANTLYTINELDRNRNILPSEFCLPDFLVQTEFQIQAFTEPMVENCSTLQHFLAFSDFCHREKIDYLKKFGSLLRKCDEVRKNREMRNFAICDVQEENVLVVPLERKIKVVDMDTCRIGRGFSSQAKYLTPYSLAMYVPKKYRTRNQFGYIEATKDSDLFCYTIMILNYIAGTNIANLDREEFYNYIDYLSYIGFNQELLNIFYRIASEGENINPDYLLDSIDEKILSKARYS